MEKCLRCAQTIQRRDDGEWHDEGDEALVFCSDQDETHDGIHHSPGPLALLGAHVLELLQGGRAVAPRSVRERARELGLAL